MNSLPVLIAAVLGSAMVAAQAPQTGSPPQTSSPQLPKGQMPELGRPTQGTDQVPLLNFDEYFVGKWTFEWDAPEGVLGPAGKITGTTVYKALGGAFYEANTDATGPAGAFKVKDLIAYQKENKTVARQVSDTRGFAYLQLASVGGDLGGLYNMYFESQPFTFKGKTIRVRDRLTLTSPVAFKVATTVSVDGGPFMNYGNRWWQKQVPGVTGR